jgi:hypothetical protein
MSPASPWRLSWRADPALAALADRHYSRRRSQVGEPQFVPPGRCLCLRTADGLAGWVSSWQVAEYARHAWAGAWVNSLFRREAGPLASDMIRAAVAHTRHYWPAVPPLGMITMVDTAAVRHKRDPGRCYRRAGFAPVGYTASGQLVLQLVPEAMPDPEPVPGAPLPLFDTAELLRMTTDGRG